MVKFAKKALFWIVYKFVCFVILPVIAIATVFVAIYSKRRGEYLQRKKDRLAKERVDSLLRGKKMLNRN